MDEKCRQDWEALPAQETGQRPSSQPPLLPSPNKGQTGTDIRHSKDGEIGSVGIWGLIGSTADDIFVSWRETPQPLSNRKLKKEISSSLFEFKPSNPPKVKHIILTGGFCAGNYVSSAIEDAVRQTTNISPGEQIGEPKYTNITPSCIRKTDEPQFCVVLGLMRAYQEEILGKLTAKENKKPGLVGKTWLRFKASLH